MIVAFARFLRDETGATAMEYGLIAALIAMIVVTAWANLGQSLGGQFNNVATHVNH